jgi:hypothetical protein
MRRLLVLLLAVVLTVSGVMAIYAGPEPAPPLGPAPNAGDGDPDRSGLDPLPFGYGEVPGPAPNSGDGISDGSGF